MCLCAYFRVHSEAVGTATSERVLSGRYFPSNMCVQWKVNGSPVYTFLKYIYSISLKKNQPWCHYEPILNPPLSESITPALPPSFSGCLIFFSTSPSFTLLPIFYILFFFLLMCPLSSKFFFFLQPCLYFFFFFFWSYFPGGEHQLFSPLLIESLASGTNKQKKGGRRNKMFWLTAVVL